MFAMNATLKPRAMAAYTGSSSNTSRERVLRVSSIGRSQTIRRAGHAKDDAKPR